MPCCHVLLGDGYAGAGIGGHEHRRRRIGGNRNSQREFFGGALPVAGDGAAHGIIIRPHPLHVADGLRGDDDLFEAVAGGLDAGQVVIKPFLNLAEHEMILRRAAVPSLGQAGLALGQLHAVAGLVRLVVDVKNHVAAPAVGQRAEQIAVAHVAGGQRVAARAHVADDGVQHGGAVGGLAQAHHQRNRIGALRAGGVKSGWSGRRIFR